MKPTAISIKGGGINQRSHLLTGIRAMGNTHTITLDVGEAGLVKPHPTWWVVTVACREIPERSEI